MKTKKALVLGGNGGIGHAVVSELLDLDFEVTATYFRNKEKLQELLEANPENKLTFLKCDFSDVRVAETTLLEIVNANDFQPDVIVFAISAPINNLRAVDLEWSTINDAFVVQLSPLLLTVKVMRPIMKLGHKIKFISILTEYCSGAPPKGLAHYVTAKYALMGLSKSLAVELSEYGSTVNMISPGMVETPLLRNLPRKLIEITAAKNPMKRNADISDISNVVGFLASERSNYLNGVNIPVNGGSVLI